MSEQGTFSIALCFCGICCRHQVFTFDLIDLEKICLTASRSGDVETVLLAAGVMRR
jgi:hypothetical protein